MVCIRIGVDRVGEGLEWRLMLVAAVGLVLVLTSGTELCSDVLVLTTSLTCK